jgi:hypothetical protein
MKNKIAIKVGDTVEYPYISGVARVKVLKVKPDGKLILETRKPLGLCKNVCVLPHRVKKVSADQKIGKISSKKVSKIDGFLAYQMFKAQNQLGAEYEGSPRLPA